MTDRSDPFEEIEQLVEQFTSLSDPFGQSIPVDVLDTADEIVVRADLPGRDPDAIDIHLEADRRLHVEAESGDTAEEGRYVSRERRRDAVSRTITLPAAVDESETEASYDQGVLTVRLPKFSGEGEGTDIPVN